MNVRPRRTVTWCLIAFLLLSMGSLAVFAGTAQKAKAASYTVTSANDSGAGTLREAIGFANGQTEDIIITFDEGAMGSNVITLTTGSLDVGNVNGWKITIKGESAVLSGFVDIKNGGGGPSNCVNLVTSQNELSWFKISGFTNGINITNPSSNNYIRHCCVVGNTGDGIVIDGSQDNRIDACYIGYDYFTPTPNGNIGNGISIRNGAKKNTIGSNSAERCVIGYNNGSGVSIVSSGSNTVGYNFIGVSDTGMGDWGNNNNGVTVDGCSDTWVGVSDPGNVGNYIGGNDNYGVLVQNSSNTQIHNNYVGIGTDGTTGIGNGADGITLQNNTYSTFLGGDASMGEGNVIGWNAGDGIFLTGDVQSAEIQGNRIGINDSLMTPIPNGNNGISINNGPHNNTIGSNNYDGRANRIAHNNGDGIIITDDMMGPPNTVQNKIGVNETYNNGGLGINLVPDPGVNDPGVCPYGTPDSPNNWMPYPDITNATTMLIEGNAVPDSDVFLYWSDGDPSGHGEGKTFITGGTNPVRADGGGYWSTSLPVGPGDSITAMAVDTSSNAGEFSNNRDVMGGGSPVINNIQPPSANNGDTISIYGTGFGGPIGGDYVEFNGDVQYGYGLWNDGEIKLQVPPGAVSGNVFVHHNGMTSNGYWFTVGGGGPPDIYNVYPGNVTYEDALTIEGNNFGAGGPGYRVYIGNDQDGGSVEEAPIDLWSNSMIIARVPKSPFEGMVRVETPYGGAKRDATRIYPSVYNIQPDNAGQWGVAIVTVEGSNIDSRNDGENVGVSLVNEGNFRDIDGLIMNADTDRIDVVFAFLGDDEGKYDVEVRNTSTGEKGVLEDGFTIGEGPEPPPVVLVTIDKPENDTFPADGESGGGAGTVEIEASATSNKAPIKYVDIYINGDKVAHDTEEPYTFDWDFSEVTSGSYEITAEAKDLMGNTGQTLLPTNVYKNGIVPNPSTEWFLPEGSTAWGFETYVLVENPNKVDTQVTVELLKEQGDNQTLSYHLAPESRFTISLNDIAPDCDLSTRVTADQPIISERSMYWKNRMGGHDSIGVTETAKEWHFAEGTTAWGFETWYLIANPSGNDATVEITCLGNDGSEVSANYEVPARTRKTVNAKDIVPNADISASIKADTEIAVERAMYWRERDGGHDTIGVTQEATTWYMAEGSTIEGFETWVLVENPGDTNANITATFMPSIGLPVENSVVVEPHSRHTIKANDVIPGRDVSIEVISDQPIICERAMYWNDRIGGHDTIGTPTPSDEWFIAEGCTAYGFEEWLLLQNADSARTATVTVTLFKGGIGTQEVSYLVTPMTRYSVSVNDLMANEPGDVSLKVTSDIPIIAERSMYWDERVGGHVSVSCRGTDGP